MASTEAPRATAGRDLHDARERLELSRTELAVRGDCSLTALANIEMGVVPKRSRVLPRAWASLREIEQQTGSAA